MPDWSRYSNYNDGAVTYTWHSITLPTVDEVQQQYEEYKQRREQQERIMEQMLREEEERIREEYLREKERMEERNKYPLFFWRETCCETCKEKK